MKPDQQSNYWQHEPEESKDDTQEPEMYAPSPLGPQSQASTTEPAPSSPQVSEEEHVRWSGQEYIHHEKNGGWFIIFGLVVVGLIALDLLFLKSYTFTALVVVMAVAIVVYSRRPPRMLDYTLSGSQGLYVNEKLYHFSEFKGFGVIQDGEHHSVMLIPTKRFALGVSVYFPEEAGERIVDLLGARLPMQPLKLDAIDVIVRKLRL